MKLTWKNAILGLAVLVGVLLIGCFEHSSSSTAPATRGFSQPIAPIETGKTLAKQSSWLSEDSSIATLNHVIKHSTTVPGFAGNEFTLNLRERIRSSNTAQQAWDARGKVVLMVHGFSVPGAVTFDLDYQNYSWLAYLAREGFDAFALDLTGYGASTRPAPMNNPCNASRRDQRKLGIEACEPTYPYHLTTLQSDWDDMDAAVDYIRQLRNVNQVSLVGVSWGGARVLGYAAAHPDKVDKLIVQGTSGAFSLNEPPNEAVAGDPLNLMTLEDLKDRWEPMIQCEDQVNSDMTAVVWAALLAADPMGATWGSGVSRSPGFSLAGLTRSRVESISLPILIVGGDLDKLAPPYWVKRLYRTVSSPKRIYANLKCASHFISFETRSADLYQLSLDWLQDLNVAGRQQGDLTIEPDGSYVWEDA